jgi:hypothetical protein
MILEELGLQNKWSMKPENYIEAAAVSHRSLIALRCMICFRIFDYVRGKPAERRKVMSLEDATSGPANAEGSQTSSEADGNTSNDSSSNEFDVAPPRNLVYFITWSSFLSLGCFFTTFFCSLNTEPIDKTDPFQARNALILTTFTVLFAGAVGGSLSNIRRLVEHSERAKNKCAIDQARAWKTYDLSYKLRPLRAALCGLIVFFVLPGAAAVAAGEESAGSWVTLAGRAPYIALALLAGFSSTEFLNKLQALADTLFESKSKEKRPAGGAGDGDPDGKV